MDMSLNNPELILDEISRIERECGAILRGADDIVSEEKDSGRNIVTQYDFEVQSILIDRLSKLCPDAHFFCEEMEHPDSLEAEEVFIIDPIDGTMNFKMHMNHSCISVAYARRGKVCASAVYNPYVDEMFSAIRGSGARLNGKAIHIADSGLSDSLFLLGTSPYCADMLEKTLKIARLALNNCLDFRRQGSAELDLCSVAAGRAGVYGEMHLSLWDYAAGSLIVEEAGGICLQIDGTELPFDPSKVSILAGSRTAVKEFLEKFI